MTFRRSLLLVLAAEALIVIAAVLLYGVNVTGLQAATRFSGRLSALLFGLIFILLPYHREKLAAILSDKFFLTFAIAHTIHFIELFWYNMIIGGTFIPLRVAGGALAYVMILTMPFLINKFPKKRRFIPENIYLFYIWLVFFVTYLPRIQGKLPYVGGKYAEFVAMFTWICLLLVIRISLTIANRKPHMHKLTLLALLVCVFLTARSQSTYDSLKLVYSAQHVFEQREKGSVQHYINRELENIHNKRIKQLAASAMVENLWGYGWVDERKLLALVDDVIENPVTEDVKTIALLVRTDVMRTLVGTKIQNIVLPSVTGDSVRLADLYPSRDYFVVDLWATWCGPCVAEMKKFNGLRKQYPTLEFYSISLDEDFERVKKFVSRNADYTWPIVWAGKNSPLSVYFKARLIPAFVIVDRNGTIVSHIVGKGLEDELKKLYKK